MATTKKVTELTAANSAANTDLVYIVADPSGVPASKKITVQNLLKTVNNVSLAANAYSNAVSAANTLAIAAYANSILIANSLAFDAYNNAYADSVSYLNEIDMGLIPVGDVTYSLGNSSLNWANLHVKYVVLASNGSVSFAANSSNWASPAPTTIGEALNRLAAVVKTLNSGTGA